MEKLTFLKADNTDREGNQLMSKAGKPYTRLSIKVESRGDRYISGFQNPANKNWTVGDEVDITIVESDKLDKTGKPYLNFQMPKKDVGNAEVLEHLVGLKLSIGALRNDVQRILDRLDGKDKPSYPESTGPTAFDESDVNPDDLPF